MPNTPKTYAPPWNGQLLLACRKCQRKLRKNDANSSIARLKKAVKRHNREHPDRELSVLNVGCMDLCPKGGITVSNPAQQPNRLSILRSQQDLEALSSPVGSAVPALVSIRR